VFELPLRLEGSEFQKRSGRPSSRTARPRPTVRLPT
jgi:hypothetical protein